MFEQHPPDLERQRNVYYWYYATQLMHHVEGETWTAWNRRMRELLVATQISEGHEAGSWGPARPLPDVRGGRGGRLCVTSLAMLSLEVYDRHLPLFSRLPEEGIEPPPVVVNR